MKCVAHRIGLVWECRGGDCDDTGAVEFETDETETADEAEHQTYKDDSSLRDQQSTGRKRAARWFPLDETKLCEWSMKTNCGGGPHPITGCAANVQQARHHGPDKNTLNNDKGNVHRICHTCHNRWHTLNDPDYVWNAVQNLHEPKTATFEDIVESENFWEGRKLVQAKD